MQTFFSDDQLNDPKLAEANRILRACVHCGMCTATCPTYQVLGDELDGPRGRIYLIKEMLESGRDPDPDTVTHIDRCLSCLACTTTCPSGVDYMHLVDQARSYIDERYNRPWRDRALRWLIARVLTNPRRMRLALLGAKLVRPVKGLLPDARLRAMVELAPKQIPPVSRTDDAQVLPAEGTRKMRVALLTGCAQRALDTDINEATVRVLRRLGCDVVIAEGIGCCGALTHHMGQEEMARSAAERNIRAWCKELDGDGLDAIVINASGCGTTVKDYGHLFARTALETDAARVAALTKDISEVLTALKPQAQAPKPLRVTYHAACSLQHGQKVRFAPKDLLKDAGFTVSEPRDSHLCCGSAGTYNLLQPEISGELKTRKLSTIRDTAPEVIATGNIGCMMQIGSGIDVPVVHTVELIDWATGGPLPEKLRRALETP